MERRRGDRQDEFLASTGVSSMLACKAMNMCFWVPILSDAGHHIAEVAITSIVLRPYSAWENVKRIEIWKLTTGMMSSCSKALSTTSLMLRGPRPSCPSPLLGVLIILWWNYHGFVQFCLSENCLWRLCLKNLGHGHKPI